MSNNKDYAIISGYGRLLVPLDMIEHLCEQGFIVEEEFDTNTNKLEISAINRITDFRVVYNNEFLACSAQQKLS